MNIFLFIICSLIWGSTWLAIKYQLGTIDPMVSILYRFFIAVVVLFLYCLVSRRKLAFSAKNHLLFFVTGSFMFCFNYWLVYVAESTLTSGLVAITFSTMIFFNAMNNRIFLKAPIVPKIIVGGLVGLCGLGLIFYQELNSFSYNEQSLVALGLCLLSALFASLGNTAAQVCHRRKIPIIQMEFFAMVYGTALIGVMALVKGAAFSFDATLPYVASLIYLGVAGSLIAFFSYLTLLRNIGSDRTAYITLVTPLVALSISTLFEGYIWSVTALFGVGFVLAGNFVALRMGRVPLS